MRDRFFRPTAVAALLAALLACKSSKPSPVSGRVVGNYTISKGLNPNGTAYKGTVVVSMSGERYSLAWNAGPVPYSGIGVEQGSVLGVAWGKGTFGVAQYTVSGGTLKGVWAQTSSNSLGSETLVGAPGLSGAYKITAAYSPVTGRKYQGNVTISGGTPTYAVSWSLSSGETYTGTGILEGASLVVAWPAGRAGAVSYQIAGDQLIGKWVQKPGGPFGFETLKR